MSQKSKTIKLFLLQGEPTGVKIIQLSNWTGKAYVIPRTQLSAVSNREELKSQCVYFLIGADDEDNLTMYIGEAEEFLSRIKQHDSKEWNIAIPFISKDENLTKAHVKYLESMLHQKMVDAGRVKITNGSYPAKSRLPEEDIEDMNYYAENMEVILSSIGYNFFESPKQTSINSSTPNQQFVISIKARETKKVFISKGVFSDEGFVLLAGSDVTCNPVKSELASITKRRMKEVELGNLVLKTDKNGVQYNCLIKDILFGSPSMAAMFACGYSANGWNKWKSEDGRTLQEFRDVYDK